MNNWKRDKGGVKKRMPVEKAVIRGERGELYSLIPSSELGQRAGSRFYGSAHVNRDRSTLISIARAR